MHDPMVDNPSHYNNGASKVGQSFLDTLGIEPNHYDLECIVAIDGYSTLMEE